MDNPHWIPPWKPQNPWIPPKYHPNTDVVTYDRSCPCQFRGHSVTNNRLLAVARVQPPRPVLLRNNGLQVQKRLVILPHRKVTVAAAQPDEVCYCGAAGVPNIKPLPCPSCGYYPQCACLPAKEIPTTIACDRCEIFTVISKDTLCFSPRPCVLAPPIRGQSRGAVPGLTSPPRRYDENGQIVVGMSPLRELRPPHYICQQEIRIAWQSRKRHSYRKDRDSKAVVLPAPPILVHLDNGRTGWILLRDLHKAQVEFRNHLSNACKWADESHCSHHTYPRYPTEQACSLPVRQPDILTEPTLPTQVTQLSFVTPPVVHVSPNNHLRDCGPK